MVEKFEVETEDIAILLKFFNELHETLALEHNSDYMGANGRCTNGVGCETCALVKKTEPLVPLIDEFLKTHEALNKVREELNK